MRRRRERERERERVEESGRERESRRERERLVPTLEAQATSLKESERERERAVSFQKRLARCLSSFKETSATFEEKPWKPCLTVVCVGPLAGRFSSSLCRYCCFVLCSLRLNPTMVRSAVNVYIRTRPTSAGSSSLRVQQDGKTIKMLLPKNAEAGKFSFA